MNKRKGSKDESFYGKYTKRACDILISSSLIIVLLPLFFTIAFIIKLNSKGPILFKQKRVGKNYQIFTIYKFRTMIIDAPHDLATAKFENPEDFITKSGKFLRKTSLDELPQLFNVFRGSMSLVGPRPLVTAESEVNEARHNLKIDLIAPGITGLAQINGRDLISNKKKIEYDKKYVDNLSFKLDFIIVCKTIKNVIIRKDIHEGIK